MSIVGCEKVKQHFLDVNQRVRLAKEWHEDLKQLKLDLVLCGRDGTSKYIIFPRTSLRRVAYKIPHSRQKTNGTTVRGIPLLHWSGSSAMLQADDWEYFSNG